MEDLKIHLSLDEINIIIKSLAEQPFKDVYELIGKINAQADNQLKSANSVKEENSEL